MAARSSGILMHPTSLPGPYGVGDLGPSASSFLVRIAEAGQDTWQMLPLHPTGEARSPYDARSTFAGDPLLLSPELLVADDLLPADALRELPPIPADRIRFGAAEALKEPLLRASWAHFQAQASSARRQQLERFERDERRADWLEDWALYAALRRRTGTSWTRWPVELRRRQPQALAAARRELSDEIAFARWAQFLFELQWSSLRSRAAELGVRLCGDLPIYVAHDSADVWAHQDLFELDPDGHSVAVAGVPPDAFAADGQHWGNPLYRWPQHREQGFQWWRRRLEVALERVDLLRLDHFRAFVAYWRIPAGAPNARSGRWARGPGRRLFDSLEQAFGRLPLIAEDLGVITPAVRRLRRTFGLPGIRVTQFGFDSDDSDHLPDRCPEDTVIYTGTHDNDTTRGWLERLDDPRRARLDRHLGARTAEMAPGEAVWRLVETTLGAASRLAVVPFQDVLGLGSSARTNTPGTVGDNWRWRLAERELDSAPLDRLRTLTAAAGRLPADPPMSGAT